MSSTSWAALTIAGAFMRATPDPEAWRHVREPLLAPARPRDPAEHLGISVGLLHTAADFQQAMQRVCSAVAAGEIGIGEAGRIARQVRTRMRGLRRLARIQRRLLRLAQKTDPARPPLG